MEGKDLKTPYQDQDDRRSVCSDVLANDSDTTASGETIYTPSSSSGTAPSKDARVDEEDAFEGDQLLSPPRYEAHPPVYESEDAKADVRDDFNSDENLNRDLEVEEADCPGRRRWGCFGRRRRRCGARSEGKPKKLGGGLRSFLLLAKFSILAYIFIQGFSVVFSGQRRSSGYVSSVVTFS